MRLIIEENDAKAGLWTARYIVARIKEKAARTDRPFVLGLPTGSTPVETYKELVRLYEAGEVSFRNVVTFNMDEYVGIPKDHLETVFNPFFTTKESGTGLGLYILNSEIQNKGGQITVESAEGKGTVFHILLPEEVENERV